MNKGKYYVLPEGVEIKEIKQIMYTSDGKYAYQDERTAEYNCAIGSMCECGNFIEGRSYTKCEACREKTQNDKYNAFELVEWDNKTPLTIFNSDIYFFHGDEDEIDNYCELYDVKKEDLQLVLCEPNYPQEFNLQDYCWDELPEDMEITDYEDKNAEYSIGDIESIVNTFLHEQPMSWSGGSKRVLLKGVKC